MKKDGSSVGSSVRASGDLWGYFLLHNMLSIFLFFVVSISLGIYTEYDMLIEYSWTQILEYVISSEFWELTVFRIFPISVICSIAGRIIAFYSVKGYYKYVDRNREVKRAMKRWSEMNSKINQMGIRFFITALITSFFYSVGLVALLSFLVFDETTLLPLIVIYSLLRFGTFYFVRWFVGSKM